MPRRDGLLDRRGTGPYRFILGYLCRVNELVAWLRGPVAQALRSANIIDVHAISNELGLQLQPIRSTIGLKEAGGVGYVVVVIVTLRWGSGHALVCDGVARQLL